MFATLKKTTLALMSAGMLAASFIPAEAMPLPAAPQAQAPQDIQAVQWRHRDGGWHNGHRGFRQYRRGYRRHSDGYWYPLAAFGAGAIIGGAIAAPPAPRYVEPARRVSGRHVQWCEARYRSYRAYDNTFQPNVGPRQACVSPYS